MSVPPKMETPQVDGVSGDADRPPASPKNLDASLTPPPAQTEIVESAAPQLADSHAIDLDTPAEEEASTSRPDLPPSIKRRESEIAETETTTSESGAPAHKKRKRGVSPPWQFPTVDSTTMKSSDGRRVSARVNTTTPGPSEHSDGRARSISTSHSASRSRQPSPPWKKFGADVPTSLTVDGKRKSGRVNREATEQPKRVSPRNKKRADKSVDYRSARGRRGESLGGARVKEEGYDSSPTRKSAMSAIKPTRSFATPTATHKRKRSAEPSDSAAKPSTANPSRRSARQSTAADLPDTTTSPRIKLRMTGARFNVPPQHPSAMDPPVIRPPRPSLYQVIEGYELKEMQQPHMEAERGPPDAEWFAQRSDKQALDEAAMRKRILEAAKPNGALSEQRLSIFQAEPQFEPLPQYGHQTHLANQAIYFQRLLSREKDTHRAQAKKLAHEAVAYWKMMRGPTPEDIQAEQAKIYRLIYKQVAMDMQGKWNMVAAHVQHLRRLKYEAEEDEKRQQRLKQRLEWSERMIAKQRGDDDTDDVDEDSTGDMIESDEDEDDSEDEEENMSDSEPDSGAEGPEEGDGEMGEDELAAYLAQRKEEPPEKEDVEVEEDSDTEMATGDVSEAVETPQTTEPEAPTTEGETSEAVAQPDVNTTDADTPMAEGEEASADQRVSARQSGADAAAPGADDADAEDDTSDESVDMFDSDEDMSSTGDENDGNDDDSGSESASEEEEEEDTGKGLLGFYQPKQLAAIAQLPTPTTSAEGDVRDATAEASSSAQIDPQADTGAAEEPKDEAVPDAPATEVIDAAQDEAVEETITSPQAKEIEKVAGDEMDTDVVEPSETALVAKSPSAGSQSDGENKLRVPQPTLLRGELRSYQWEGLRWLASLNDHGTNGILADEMGLGKTIQTISLLAHLAEQKNVWETHLVIVPTSVVLNWVTEFQRFLPGFRVLGYYGSAEERQMKRRGWVNDPHHHDKTKRGYNAVITSYNVAMQDINAIRNVQWNYLVLDEAHNIRNFNSQRWQVLIRLKTRGRLLLTGTPLQNSLTELWSLLTFLTAGDDDPAHGNLEEFLSHWKEPVKEIFDRGVSALSAEAQKIVDQLHISLRPFLLRRLKTEVEKDLPKKTESVVVCKLSKRQRQLYQEYMGLASTRESLQKGNAVSAGRVLMSLRRVCNHPDLFDPRPIQTSYAMEQSALEPFTVKEALVRKMLGVKEDLPSEYIVAGNERRRRYSLKRSRQLASTAPIEKEIKELEAVPAESPDLSTATGIRAFQKVRRRENKLKHLRECIRITNASLKDSPIYGSDLREVLTVHSDKLYTHLQPGRPPVKTLRCWPKMSHRPFAFEHKADWLISKTTNLQNDVLTLNKFAEGLQDTIVRFAFCTPVVTAPVLKETITPHNQEIIRASAAYPTSPDFGHEARQRTSILFPDARLLTYDSGKLQRLSVLLRQLQAKGSRSLIFTQMVKVLDILEQFLSMMGLPYLRLDGSTSVEKRQMYSAEFNQPDSKYQCMILSSRAGGVGLNLTGASSVIFYDLDWNPQMDRQCMDRAHRIGQVRDVEVFKMVSEKTVEENILRRANQKSLLDQTVIQEGHFTTDHRTQARPAEEDEEEAEDDVNAAIERYLGGGDKASTNAMENVEDTEDVKAAQQARKEEQQDEIDFAESKGPSGAATPGVLGPEVAEADDGRGGHIDAYMIKEMERELTVSGWVYAPPVAKRLDKHGRDRSHRPKKKR